MKALTVKFSGIRNDIEIIWNSDENIVHIISTSNNNKEDKQVFHLTVAESLQLAKSLKKNLKNLYNK